VVRSLEWTFGRGDERNEFLQKLMLEPSPHFIAHNTHSLPEGEEYHKLNANNFQKWLMLSDIGLELVVELDKPIHSYCHRKGLE